MFVARLALRSLKNMEFSEKKKEPITDAAVIEARVLRIVLANENGISTEQMDEAYEQLYNEHLPKNWVSSVINAKSIEKKPLLMLYPKKLPEEVTYDLHILSVEKNEEEAIDVLDIKNPTEIWARYKSAVDKFADLQSFYSEYDTATLNRSVIKVGKYYCYNHENKWHRVLCVYYGAAAKKAAVFFIDNGQEMIVDPKHLHFLVEKFYKTPAQAFRLGIYELLEWIDYPELVPIAKKNLSRETMHVKFFSKMSHDDKGIFYPATFIDSKTKDNINHIIGKEFFLQIGKLQEISKSKNGAISFPATVSFVSDEGEIYLHHSYKGKSVKNTVQETFTIMLTRLVNESHIEEDTLEGDLECIVRDPFGLWYRGRAEEEVDEGLIKMYLVDYGDSIDIGVDDIVSGNKVPEFLWKLPVQATKIKLSKVSKAVLMENLEFVRSILAEMSTAEIRGMPSKDSEPLVEVFRNGEKNVPESINDIILSKTTIKKKTIKLKFPDTHKIEKTENFQNGEKLDINLKPKMYTPWSNGDYKKETGYDIEKYGSITVDVIAVENPCSFIVQRRELQTLLQEMEVEMQIAYAHSYQVSSELDTLKEHDVVAVRYTDNMWYRARFVKIVGWNKCDIYLCDWGYDYTCTFADIQPLHANFQKLPDQASKAKLFGIKPIGNGWGEDSVDYFHKFVTETCFDVRVRDVQNDSGRNILSLVLIDPLNAISINQLLVEKNMAADAGILQY